MIMSARNGQPLLTVIWAPVAIFCAIVLAVMPGCRGAESSGVTVRPLTLDTGDDRTLAHEFPSASPDGRHLLFQRSDDPRPQRHPDGTTRMDFLDESDWDIYRMNLEGGERVRLTAHPALEDQPVWSPDGQTIAYRFLNHGSFDIYLMDPDGGNQRPLVDLPESDEKTPAFSPDGRRIVFFSDRDGVRWNLYTVDVETREIVRLTRDDVEYKHPQFTLDGGEVVFHSNRDPAIVTKRGASHNLMNIFALNLGTGVIRQLTRSEGVQDNRHPWLSPDGRFIAYHSTTFEPPLSGAGSADQTDRDLYVMSLDGTRRVNLTRSDKRQFKHPSWSADGKGIFCVYKPQKDRAWAIGYIDVTDALRQLG